MESRIKLFGHPIHPMLIVFPLGLLAISFVLDVAYLITQNPTWSDVAYYDMIIGIIMGLVAAVFGFLEWLAIPDGTRAKRIGLLHGAGNVVVVALFLLSWFVRRGAPARLPSTTAFILSLVAILLALVTGWLGGELVDRLGVGVDRGANLNASSSLSGQPADSSRATGD
jgi:uncharacterized membrane protein